MIVWGHFARHNPAPMQKSPDRSYAFTLIELLVVISIIAILIGLLFPAFRAVQNQAKQTQAKNDLTQIVNAVNAYYTDYGSIRPRRRAITSMVIQPQCYAQAAPPTPQTTFCSIDFGRAMQQIRRVQQLPHLTHDKSCLSLHPHVKDPSQPRSGIGTTTGQGTYFDPWESLIT